MGLIRFLLIAIAALYIIRLLARLLLPMFFQSMVKKAQQQQSQYNNRQPNRPEGSVKVDYVPQDTKSSIPDTEGEFVEYEEIKK